MSPLGSAQLGFAAELATFLVSLAGVLTVVRTAALTRRSALRPVLVAGFGGLAASAFLHGALLVEEPDAPILLAFLAVGVAGLAAGLAGWRSRGSGLLLAGGIACFALVLVATLTDHVTAADVLRCVGSLSLAAALVAAARRTISARIAVDGALLVLCVVVAVSLVVSFTVAGSVEDEAFRRYGARGATEAELAASNARTGLGPARIVAGVLASERAPVLARIASEAPSSDDETLLDDALGQLTDDGLLGLDQPVILLSATGRPVAASPPDLSDATRLAVAGDELVTEALTAGAERQGVVVVGHEAFALSAAPVRLRPADAPEVPAGLVVVAHRLDDAYLRLLGSGGESLGFVLSTPSRVLATSRPDARLGGIDALVQRSLGTGEVARARLGDAFAVARPVPVSTGRSPLALVVVAPGDAARQARADLFRALFLAALGAAFLAVSLAAVVGERIGRGLRRLTASARALQAGDLDPAVDVRSDDELGVLGRAFGAMARSIREMTGELRASAAQEAELRARLEAVVSGMSEALVAVDADGRLIELNVAAEDVLGLDRRLALGRPVAELVRWRADDGRAVPLARRDLPDGQPMAADVAVGDGSVPVEVTAGSLVDEDGRDAGAVMVFRDVRRERQVEDLKASILANISHELRTPLTPIKGYAVMLRDRDVPPPSARGFAGDIVAGVDQLEATVRRLVTFATISAGNLRTDPRPVPVDQLAEGVEARWRERAPDGRTLRVVGDAPPAEVVVDRPLVDLAIDELVDNAFKYSPDGGEVAVRFSTTRDVEVEQATPGPVLLVEVTDHGVGFDPAGLDAIADPFVQQDGSATRRFGGLGLGLACTDRIVRAHGGKLDLTSVRQAVTRVTILLPAGAPR